MSFVRFLIFATILITGSTAYAASNESVSKPIGKTISAKQKHYNTQIDVPARIAVVELNQMSGATNYQVQIEALDRIWATVYKFDLTNGDPKLRLRLTPGQYKIRTRSFDDNGFFGDWSGWASIWVNYKPVDQMFPTNGGFIKPKTTLNERIAFEWPEIRDAETYLFVLKNASGKIIKQYQTQNLWTYEELELSSRYFWTVMPIKKRHWKQQITPELLNDLDYNEFRVGAPVSSTRGTTIRATPVPRAEKYQFEFLKLDNLGERGFASIYESQNAELPVSLASATYEVRVRTFFSDGSVSDWSAPSNFIVPFDEVDVLGPEDGFLYENLDDIIPYVDLSWHPQEDVHRYVVYLYDRDGNFIRTFKTPESRIHLELPDNKTYRWHVIAHSAGQEDIKPPPVNAKMRSFHIAKKDPLGLGRTEEPASIYAWGRYWTSKMNYDSRSYDLDSRVRQQIYGGTGEVALGYWNETTNLGLLGAVSVTGFNIDDQIYNYASGGLHVGYRVNYWRGARLRVWTGWNYTEFPEIRRHPIYKDVDFYRIKSMGPQIQVSFMDSFRWSPDFGYHIYGIVYRNFLGIETPNGLYQVPTNSYTGGLFGTYKWNQQFKLQVGYSYKHEEIRYKSTDRTGNDNFSLVNGHFLNLSLEIGLTEE